MKRTRLAALAGLGLSVSLVLAGCGAASSSAPQADDGKEMTVQVFDSLGNDAGIQKGWFGKVVHDKFNLKLNYISPNVNGGGDSLFDTRSAAGNLGDIIIVSNTKLAKLIRAHLVSDMTPYLKGMKNLQRFKSAPQAVNRSIGQNSGIWAYPSNVAIDSPTKSSAAVDPDGAPYIRWDYYREIGYPAIHSMDDFITVLKRMQDRARKDTGKNDIYAISLFKDWDGTLMQNAAVLAQWFGYMEHDNILFQPNSDKYATPIDKNGIYQQMLRFLYRCNKAGLVDPESSTQNWDRLDQKVANGKVLMMYYSFCNWHQNTPENMKKGIGFEIAPLEPMKVYTAGFKPEGDTTTVIALGSKAKNKQRLVKFIDWLYSSYYTYMNNATIPDLAFKYNSKHEPYLTAFGERSLFNATGLNMPKSWGGGSAVSGGPHINYSAVAYSSTDPETGESYNARIWKSQLNKPLDNLTKEWSQHMDGAKTTMEYLTKTHRSEVAPGASYAPPETPSALAVVQSQIKTEVIAHSWKAVMAENDEAYNKEINAMISETKGLGYDKVEAFDLKCISQWRAAMRQITKDYANKK